MDNVCEDNLTYGVSELAKRSNISVSLAGWPAAFCDTMTGARALRRTIDIVSSDVIYIRPC